MVELPLMNLIEYAAVLQELPLRSPCMVSYFCSLFFLTFMMQGCQTTWSRGLVMPGFCGKAQPIRLRELCGGVVKAISSIFLVPKRTFGSSSMPPAPSWFSWVGASTMENSPKNSRMNAT